MCVVNTSREVSHKDAAVNYAKSIEQKKGETDEAQAASTQAESSAAPVSCCCRWLIMRTYVPADEKKQEPAAFIHT